MGGVKIMEHFLKGGKMGALIYSFSSTKADKKHVRLLTTL